MDSIIVFWLMIGVIVVASIYFRHQTAIKRTQVLQAMVEKGAPIPPDLFQEPRRRPFGAHTFITTGIILLAMGAGMLVFFLALTSAQFGIDDRNEVRFLPFISAFPLFIGFGCLLAGRYLKTHE